MPKNIIVITSIINIPDKPLSYTNIRSIYSRNERFEQTKKTIQTLKNKIPDSEIMVIECSELDEEELNYIKTNVNYFLNLYGNAELEDNILGLSKSMGENMLLLNAIEYLNSNNIQYENFYKISGRYWLNENFNYDDFNNDKIVVVYELKKNELYQCIVYTSFYKLNYKHINSYVNYINNNKKDLEKCICAESFFGNFLIILDENGDEIKQLQTAGVSGYVAVWNNFFIEY